MAIFDTLKEAAVIARKKRSDRKDSRERFVIALLFNRRYCNAGMLSNGKWMCPICNEVHVSTGWNFLTGPQYPACCGIEQGHRLYAHHATEDTTP